MNYSIQVSFTGKRGGGGKRRTNLKNTYSAEGAENRQAVTRKGGRGNLQIRRVGSRRGGREKKKNEFECVTASKKEKKMGGKKRRVV